MLKESIISGNSKRICTASPLQVSSLRKQYLRSLSPKQAPSFHQQKSRPQQNFQIFKVKTLTFDFENDFKKRKPISFPTYKEISHPWTPKKPKVPRKVIFQERLRLNNL